MAQVGAVQLGATKVGAAKVGVAQARAAKVDAAEVAPVQRGGQAARLHPVPIAAGMARRPPTGHPGAGSLREWVFAREDDDG